MRQYKLNSLLLAFHASRMSGTILNGMLLFAVSLLFLVPTWAQTHSATDHAPAPVNLNNSPAAQSRTPLEVVNGTAKLLGRYNPVAKLRVTLGIKAPKAAEADKFIQTLYDKASPNFHKYLTPEQWIARFSPSVQDEQAVVDWATQSGLTITMRFPNRLTVDVEGSSETIEKAFSVTVNSYQLGTYKVFSNDHDPVIPSSLTAILHSVAGLNNIQRLRSKNTSVKDMMGPDYSPGPVSMLGSTIKKDGDVSAYKSAMKSSKAKLERGVTPDITGGLYDPTDLYNSNGYDFNALQAQGHCCNPNQNSAGSPPETSIGIATAFDFANTDLAAFQSRYSYLSYNVSRHFIGGTPTCCNNETTLDLEWSLSMANSFGSYLDTSHVHVYEVATNTLGTFSTMFQTMLTDNLVRVVTTSWGCAEFDCYDSGTMDTQHNTFNQMLGQGWTILAASDDGGATAYWYTDGNQVNHCTNHLSVDFPASDPDVMAVGGTTLQLYSDGTFASESAWQGSTYSGACGQNNGGSGGGCSAKYAAPGYQNNSGANETPFCGAGSRSVPDISLNASVGENYYVNGAWAYGGGTSIATPETAGFIAQTNAYFLAIGQGCGTNRAYTCAPIGLANNYLYYLGSNPNYAAHYPFYDQTSGCNNNDNTAAFGLGYYCAGTGYDAVTGWGSYNALQLTRGIGTYLMGDFGAPVITFSGPTVSTISNTWYNTDQNVNWTVADTTGYSGPATGVSGFSQAWDTVFSDPTSEPTPGSGNSFYSGPQFPNATSGYLTLSSAGQGCHYATVNAWDNTGVSSGNQFYYWLCYDTVVPTTSSVNSPAANANGWSNQNVNVSISAADAGGSQASGVSQTYYGVNSGSCSSGNLGACSVYSSPLTFTAEGYNYVYYLAKDVAGNFSSEFYSLVYIDKTAPITNVGLAGTLTSGSYTTTVNVTLSASDALSGVQTTSYQLDGGAVTPYSAPFSVSSLGGHSVKFFSTDKAGNTESTKSISFSISATTTTTLAATPNPAVNGQTVTLTATVAATLGANPTGTVTFKNGGSAIGTASVSGGHASITTTTLPFGSDTLTATYSGATNIFGSVSAAVVEVYKEKTASTLVSSLNPSAFGQAVTLTVTVAPSISGTPTGTVQFYDGATLISTQTLAGAVAHLTTSTLTASSHNLTAVYSGSSIYNASTSAVVAQVVQKQTTTTTLASSLNPSQYLQNVTFTATVSSPSGTPTGTVVFQRNGAVIGTGTLVTGKATFSTSAFAPGSYTILAVYSNSNYVTSSSPALTQVVQLATTTTNLTSSLNPTSYGQSVTFKATVVPGTSGVPTGSVTFKDAGVYLGLSATVGGSATLTVAGLAPGVHTITAVYSGSSNYATSTSVVLSQTVNHPTTTTALTSSLNPSTHGTAVTFKATVTASSGPAPTGTVNFKDGATTIGTGSLASTGIASFTTSALTVATHSITAQYVGTTLDLGSTSGVVSQVVH